MSKIVNLNDVFISYSRRNTEFARKLNQAFIDREMTVWADWEEIPKGSEWRAEIQAGVEGADAFLFIISPDSAKSVECRKEIELALANHKRLVPVLHVELKDAESKAALHPAIDAHNWIFARESDDWDRAFEEIVSTVQTDLDHVHTHTRLNVRAHEWDVHQRDSSFLLTGKEIADAEAWLAAGATKQPEPTQLHNDYIFASRAADVRRQRRILTGVIIALVVSIALTFLAVVLGVEAERQRGIAVTQQALAERNAAVSQSVALASGAQEAISYDQTKAVALALESVKIENPPALAQRVLGEVAYRPGPEHVLIGHADTVTSLAVSPDGTKALSGSDDDTMILWDLETGEQLHVYADHTDNINGVAFSPDGKIAASASRDETVILYDVESGEILHHLEAHEDRVLALAFSPDGQTLVSASRDDTLYIWDVKTGEPLHHLEGHDARVFAVAISPDSATIVSGGEDGRIILWDAATGENLREIPAHSDVVNSLAFSPDGQTFASASSDRGITLWNAETGEPVRTFIGHTRLVQTVVFSPDGRFLLSGGNDRAIILWEVATGEVMNQFSGLDFIRAVDFSPDGQKFIANAPNGGIFIWDIRPGNILHEFPVDADSTSVNAVAFSPDGSMIASGTTANTVVITDAASGEHLHTFADLPADVHAVAFSSDGQLLAAGFDEGGVMIWNVSTGEVAREISYPNPVLTLAFSPDSKSLAGGDYQFVAGDVVLWDTATGELLNTFKGHTGNVTSVAFNAAGTLIASASEDHTVKVWDVAGSVENVRTFDAHTAAVESVVFSPDGQYLLSASRDQTIRLWTLAGEVVRIFTGHANWIHGLAFSPDGQYFVSASYDQTILLWNISNRDPIQSFTGHLDYVYSVAFAPDGHSFISGGANDSRVIQWRLDTLPELIEWTTENRFAVVLDCNTGRRFNLVVADSCL